MLTYGLLSGEDGEAMWLYSCCLVLSFAEQGVCKYLSATTSFKWASSASSGSNSSSGTNEDSSSGSTSWLAACEELRGSMRASRGKLLLELVETLGGKPVSMKVCQPAL